MYVYRSIQEMRAVRGGKVTSFELKETKGKNYMALHDLVTSKQRQIIDTGNRVYRMVELEPGKHYQIPEPEVMASISEKFKEKRRYSDSLKAKLIANNVNFKETVCKTCGGRGRFLVYDTVVEVHGSNKAKRKKDDSPQDRED